MVFVLDQHKKPLMPCTPRRARLLLTRKRAVVHRLSPFTIRLKDRSIQQSTVQPVVLKIDPGSKTTGLALARVEESEEGEVHHALHLAELIHRGEEIRDRLRKRAVYRRRRRSANLRYRPARFLNRRRAPGWLPPSLRSRIDNVVSWASRYRRWVPLMRLEVERVKFDTQRLAESGDLRGRIPARGTGRLGSASVSAGEVRVHVRLLRSRRDALPTGPYPAAQPRWLRPRVQPGAQLPRVQRRQGRSHRRAIRPSRGGGPGQPSPAGCGRRQRHALCAL